MNWRGYNWCSGGGTFCDMEGQVWCCGGDTFHDTMKESRTSSGMSLPSVKTDRSLDNRRRVSTAKLVIFTAKVKVQSANGGYSHAHNW